MAGEIKSSKSATEAAAVGIESISQYLDMKISIYDEETTIPANQNAKDAFEDAATTAKLFGTQLSQEAQNIRSIGLAFEEVDKLCAELQKGIE